MSGAVERDRRDRSVLRDTPRRDPCVHASGSSPPPAAEVTGLAVNVSATAESLVTPIVLAPDGSGVR